MDTLLIDQTYKGEKKVKSIEDLTVNSSFEAPVFESVSTLTNLFEESQYGELSNFFTNMFLCREEDKLVWKPSPTGAFSVKSFCKVVEGRPRSRASCALAWVGMVPPLVEAFYWLAVAGRVSMADMLRRAVLWRRASWTCVMCRFAEETVDRLFIYCEIGSSIWNHQVHRFGISWCSP